MPWGMIFAAVVLGVILVIGAVFISNRVRGDDDDEDDAVDLAGDADPSVSVPIRARASALSTPGKIAVASMFLALLGMAGWAYFTIRGGSPAGAAYADRLMMAGGVGIGFFGGIIARGQIEERVGVMYNEVETGDGNTNVEQVEVDVVNTRHDSDGNLLVKEYADRKVLGLFRRYRLCGEETKLNGRPPSKPVEHTVPNHATQIDDTRYHQRTRGRQAQNTPFAEAEWAYSSPWEVSYSEYIDIQESKRRMQIKLQNFEKRLSVVTSDKSKMERKLDSEEYDAIEEILEQLKEIQELAGSNDHDEDGQRQPMTQMPFQLSQPQQGQNQQPATDGGEQ